MKEIIGAVWSAIALSRARVEALPQGALASAALFLSNFLVAKLTIYAAPIAIAAFASPDVYGGIELAQSVGLMTTSFFVGAPLAGVTQCYLIKGERHVGDQLAAIGLLFCSLGLLATTMCWLAGVDRMSLLVVASFATLVVHNGGAAWFRMRAKRNQIAWVDGSALLLSLLIVLLVLVFDGVTTLASVTRGYAILTAVSIGASLLILIKSLQAGLVERLKRSTSIGFPMVVVGAMATWLGVGGRITVGLLDPSNVAAYGVAFRIAGFALGLHQLVMTAAFARVYRSRTREADAILSVFFAGVGLLSGAIAIFGPPIVSLLKLNALDAGGKAVFASTLSLTCVQTFFWIGYAMLQVRINRSGLAKRAVAPTIALTLCGAAVIFLVAKIFAAGIALISLMIAVHAAAYFALNAYVLAGMGRMPHRRMTIVGVVGGIGLATLAAVGKLA